MQPVKQIALTLGSTAAGAGYQVEVSSDGVAWTSVATLAAQTPGAGRGGAGRPGAGGPGGRGGGGALGGGPGAGAAPANIETDARARYVRVEFTQLPDNAVASIRELSVYPARYVPEYYNVTYKYRLRWDNVTYEPGELKAVAYKGGAKIGEQVIAQRDRPRRFVSRRTGPLWRPRARIFPTSWWRRSMRRGTSLRWRTTWCSLMCKAPARSPESTTATTLARLLPG